MKKLTVILLLAHGTLIAAWGQNLVPNPSFEDTVACPDNQNQVDRAVGWSNFSDFSSDYFHACSGNPNFSVPYNWGGGRTPLLVMPMQDYIRWNYHFKMSMSL